jgi:DNA-binding transcriptional ArsR family regulator
MPSKTAQSAVTHLQHADHAQSRLPIHNHSVIFDPITTRLWIHMSDAHDQLFRALADPTRRAIFEALCNGGEQTVGVLTTQAQVSQPAVSKHLAVLKQAGLVLDRHAGRQTHYSARPESLAPLVGWTSQMTRFWESRFDDLDNLLKRMDQ